MPKYFWLVLRISEVAHLPPGMFQVSWKCSTDAGATKMYEVSDEGTICPDEEFMWRASGGSGSNPIGKRELKLKLLRIENRVPHNHSSAALCLSKCYPYGTEWTGKLTARSRREQAVLTVTVVAHARCPAPIDPTGSKRRRSTVRFTEKPPATREIAVDESPVGDSVCPVYREFPRRALMHGSRDGSTDNSCTIVALSARSSGESEQSSFSSDISSSSCSSESTSCASFQPASRPALGGRMFSARSSECSSNALSGASKRSVPFINYPWSKQLLSPSGISWPISNPGSGLQPLHSWKEVTEDEGLRGTTLEPPISQLVLLTPRDDEEAEGQGSPLSALSAKNCAPCTII
eukprot:NODE_2565_length_1168_cov_28.175156_g2344_i0.p1 GENE.NODE_2565_length_1168_cov_28.175156_g2344_i0~~NODE_2565_length_1168_cov_28.175156_g2344_i0.p1  ORF type:complete len:349 (+),score=17.39 NODE_2565_length_1168_cov_28.175156_g2344_i0:91-1137(+)